MSCRFHPSAFRASSLLFERVLFAVEGQAAFEPALDGLATAVQRAVDADDRAAARGGQFDPAAVAQGQTVRRDEAEAAAADVAGVQRPRQRSPPVAEQLKSG